jgi:penicillin-binding protein 1A
MVTIYGTFANRGVRPEPYYLTRIETSNGDTIVEFENPKPRQRVLPIDESDMMIKMMQTVVDSGTASRLRYVYGLYNNIAGKTGTTQNHSDGWFLGFTPNLVAGAWVGADSPRIRFRSLSLGQGASTALPIWGLFMQKLYKDPEFKNLRYAAFQAPSADVLERLDCPPFLEEMPEYLDSLDMDGGFNADMEKLFESIFSNKKGKNTHVNPDGSVREQTEEERRSEEIQKNNAKLEKKRERQKKRQEFWDNLKKKNN